LLGVARRQPLRKPFGLPWLSRQTLTVHEADDEPLVFSLRQLWAFAPSWEVCDADGHRVGLVRRGWVLDRFGQCLAWVDETHPDRLRFHGRDGRELARITGSGDDRELTFGDELRGEPFIKMALLAAVLSDTIVG
jgi:hypothetical protein